MTGDSKKTASFAIKLKEPWLHIYRDGQYDAAELLLRFNSDHRIKILNIAGPRASKEPQIAAFVKKVLEEAFCSPQHPLHRRWENRSIGEDSKSAADKTQYNC